MKKFLFFILPVLLFFLVIPAETTQAFSDVQGYHLYYDAVRYITKGQTPDYMDEITISAIANGYQDGTFHPDNKINRAELLKIVTNASYNSTEIDEYQNTNCFRDVPTDAWFTKYVCFAKAKGVVSGYPDGTFRPAQNISLVEALKISLTALGYDYNASSSPWYKGVVEKASAFYFIPYDVEGFSYEINRGQMAHVIMKMIKYNQTNIVDSAPAYNLFNKNENCSVTYDTLERQENIMKKCATVIDIHTDVGIGKMYVKKDSSKISFKDTRFNMITGLENLPNLFDVEINNSEVSDLKFLSNQRQLTGIFITNSKVKDISQIVSLKDLITLNLTGNEISNIEVVTNLTKLQKLYLSNNKIVNIPNLSTLKSLKDLKLDNNQIVSIKNINNLADLGSLYLDSNKIDDLNIDWYLPRLFYLDLSKNNISSVEGLDKMMKLRSLNLSDNNISNVSGLKNLPELEGLTLSRNPCRDESCEVNTLKQIWGLEMIDTGLTTLSFLKGMDKMERLTLSHNKISDITALAGLTNLWQVDLNYNQISDISALGSSKKLTDLHLNHNLISDIGVINDLPNIFRLSLADNKIKNIAVLSGRQIRDVVNLSHNLISDISPLAGSTFGRIILNNNTITDASAIKDLTLELIPGAVAMLNNPIKEGTFIPKNVITKSTMRLSIDAFVDGGDIPVNYTCDGENSMPEIKYDDYLFGSYVFGTESQVLIVDDPDAGEKPWTHFLLWNMSLYGGEVTFREEEFKKFYSDGVTYNVLGKTDFGKTGYDGPCPPKEDNAHTYRFTLYGLDKVLNLTEGATREDLDAAMKGSIVYQSKYTGIYDRD